MAAALQTDETREAIFYFNCDHATIDLNSRQFDAEGEDDPMFVRGNIDMSSIAYPITALT